MSLLLRHARLGRLTTFRVDEPELEELARDLHSTALAGAGLCSPDTPSDLAWQRAPDGRWRILLKGAPWQDISMPKESLFLQSDSLLDDLVREQLLDHPLLHAGAVANDSGEAAIICGGSGSGKTSLVISCVLRGWNWLSDELLCFRAPDPLVAEGVCRNFNIKERAFPDFPQTAALRGSREFIVDDWRRRIRFFNPDALPGGSFAPRGRIKAIIVPEYSAGMQSPEVAALDGPALVQRLAPELRAPPVRTLAWLAEVARTVPAFILRHGNPGEAADCLIKLLRRL